ncbi:hypothetical protein ACJMK2_007430 [Sinanodonta woodiana]|uniref:Uncharacterized protein n=1 Tax=Sinanodonta woodiana TaxID=1069815 RepID=A0ABD3VIJ6_SINWO
MRDFVDFSVCIVLHYTCILSIRRFLVLVNTSFDATTRERKAEKNIRRYFSYIMNGVDQLYNGINDPTIAISVKIRAFVVFKALTQFPHRLSQVQMTGSTAKINASDYLDDLKNHDLSGAFNQIPDYDQVILFTRLGAVHDGDDTAKGCKADDFFVMAPKLVDFDPNKKYSVNPWLFSTCSVEAFKRTLVTKPDLTKKHVYTQAELAEWNKFMAKLPGVKYSPNMQCELIIGPGSALCSVCKNSKSQCAQEVCSIQKSIAF